ncbi:MAG: B12-binding domain-containing radical SAM protein [Nitrospirae bacterium]|nr:B12-binding domain-containing radical SAM protein [Nitrospirota bacterium]MBI3378839.1 B12-binding domain-containing radical SAM protein [Nitrospirota bacterium]
MKITLICPYKYPYAFGIRTLSALLKEKGYQVNLLFLPIDHWEKYNKKIVDQVAEIAGDSSVIGITLMSMFINTVASLTESLKNRCNIPIVWGGAHPTVAPNESLKFADMICISEGETSFVTLLEKIKKGEDIANIAGIWSKRNNSIFSTPPSPLVRDLDQLPFQDFDCKSHYLLVGDDILKMNDEIARNFLGTTYLTIASRGCPHACAYCINYRLNELHKGDRRIRKRSLDNLYKELVEIKKKTPFINNIWIDDDMFFVSYSTEEIRDFCGKYKENISMPLSISGATAKSLTKEKLEILVDAGLSATRIGIQSGSARTLAMYKRVQNNDEIIRAAKLANQYKKSLRVTYDIIVDNPWELEEDLITTLKFLSRLPWPRSISVRSLIFIPGHISIRNGKKRRYACQ